jgi:hypothetical protein
MTSADIKWSWERAFEMKAVRYFFAKAMFPGEARGCRSRGQVHYPL